MHRFNISVPKKYTKDGEEKKSWKTVGKMIYWPANGEKEESYSLELHMFPDTKFYVFKEKDQNEDKDAEAGAVAW